MRDQEQYDSGYRDGWSNKERQNSHPGYVQGYLHGAYERQSAEWIAQRRREEVKLLWRRLAWVLLAGAVVYLLICGPRAHAMSQGGTVRICQDLAVLSRDVAQRRDEGFPPAAVIAIFAPSPDLSISTAERDPGVLREETELRETVIRVVSMTYSQPQYGPGEVHDTVYTTCLDRGRAYGLVP